MAKSSYTAPLPGVNLEGLEGHLIVIEGPDSSGRTTQISLLSQWLETAGFAVSQVGLKRSKLVANQLEKAKQGNVLGPRTMSLFYATDFYDQLENRIVPALRAGFVVLADRYIYTLMARDLVRGANPDWLDSLYGKAIVPDAVFHLSAPAETLAQRTLLNDGHMDYWESGMDLGLSRNWFQSFVEYQKRMSETFAALAERHPIEQLDGARDYMEVQEDLRERVGRMVGIPALAT